MKLALIHLSDIHIRCDQNLVVIPSENPVLRRAEQIAQAVNSVCYGVQNGIIVVSGDTAYSGKEMEFSQGHALIEGIRSGLRTSFADAPVLVLTVAGNHDCDFGLSNSIRKIVLDSLKPNNIDEDVIEQCTGLQRHYSTFARQFNPPAAGTIATAIDRLYSQAVVELGKKRIVFHLLNSAWVSLFQEKAGSLYYPIRMIRDRVATAPAADIAVAVVHHPFNWYWPENGRDLRTFLEDNADLILTGHEHVPGAYGKRADTGEQNEYLEGGVLQETGQPDTSSFNVVLFDTVQGQQQTHRFVWQGDHYAPRGESYWRPFERNKRLTRNQFGFSEAFSQWIEDPGAGYTHAHKFGITLSDIFVYPDMREVHYDRENVDQPVIRSQDVVTYILNNSRVIIVAEEKAGKTTLTKSLVKDLHHNGKVAVALNGESLRNCLDGDRVRREIDRMLTEEFGGGLADRFWQLEPTQRAVVVDDFHKMGGNRKGKERVAELLRERFGIVVLIAGEEYRVEELSLPVTEHHALSKFKQCSVLQFGLALRHTLISKWCRLGREFTEDEIHIQREIKRSEAQISNIISIDFLPSFPVFILILLQQLESSSKLTTTSGSFGYLYEVLVTASLSRRKATRDELDTIYTYLSEFSYHLFVRRRRAIAEDEVREWYEAHCRDYKLPLMDFRTLFDELAAAGVIDTRRGDYRFRYKYLYYFFAARYFRDNINKPAIQEHIAGLSRRLHHEESANIMIFLCHLSKDERVLGAMLEAAKNLFATSPRFDISKQTAFLNRVNEELPKLTLTEDNPADNRKRMLEEQDSVLRREQADRAEEPAEVEEPDGEISELSRINASFKTIQILGQVLRNFVGSLKGEPKQQLVEECYGLGLRLLGNIFKMVEDGLPGLAKILLHQTRVQSKTLTEEEIQNQVRRLLSGLLQMLTFSVFRHVSDSIGTEKLSQTLAEVNSKYDNKSIQVIDLSIRLDHFEHFPRIQIEEAVKEFSGNYFAMSLLRVMVWHHLYLFPVDYRHKQFACGKLHISLESQAKLLASDPKKIAIPRARDSKSRDKEERSKKKEKRKQAKRSRRRGG